MSPCRFDCVVHACGHETLQHREGPYPSCHINHPQEFRERYATDTTICVQQFCGSVDCATKPLNAKAITKAVRLLRDTLVENEKDIKELTDALNYMSSQSMNVVRPQPLDHACRCVHKVYSNLAMLHPYVDNPADYAPTENHRRVFTDAFKIAVGHLESIPSCVRDARKQISQMDGYNSFVENKSLPGLGGAQLAATEKLTFKPARRLCASLSLGFEFGSPTEQQFHVAQPASSLLSLPYKRPGPELMAGSFHMKPACFVHADDASQNLFMPTPVDGTNEAFPKPVPHFLDNEMEDDNWHVWRWAGTDEEKRLAIKYEGIMKELNIVRMPQILEEARRREAAAKTQRVDSEEEEEQVGSDQPRFAQPCRPGSHTSYLRQDARSQIGATPVSMASRHASPLVNNMTGMYDYLDVHRATEHETAPNLAQPRNLLHRSNMLDVPPNTPHMNFGNQPVDPNRTLLASLGYTTSGSTSGAATHYGPHGFPAGAQFTPQGVFIPFSQQLNTASYQQALRATGYPAVETDPQLSNIYGQMYNYPTGTNRTSTNGNSQAWATATAAAPVRQPSQPILTPADSQSSSQQQRQRRGGIWLPRDVSPSKPLGGPHLCDRCNKANSSMRELYHHLQVCRAQKCTGCGTVCASGPAMFEHRRHCAQANVKVRIADDTPDDISSSILSDSSFDL